MIHINQVLSQFPNFSRITAVQENCINVASQKAFIKFCLHADNSLYVPRNVPPVIPLDTNFAACHAKCCKSAEGQAGIPI